MAFLVANLIVAATAVRLARVAPLRGGLDRALAAAVVGVAQIVVSLLIAGAVFQSLEPGTVVVTNGILAIAVFGLTGGLKPPRGAPTNRSGTPPRPLTAGSPATRTSVRGGNPSEETKCSRAQRQRSAAQF